MDAFRVLEIKKSVFENNDRQADLLREELKRNHTFLLNLMSSPGSGKTTTLMATINALKDDLRIGVMEADIDSDVDAATISTSGAKVIQLHTGGMCHLLQQVTDANGRNQNGQRRCFTQRPVCHPFYQNSQHGADNHRKDDGYSRIPAEGTKGKENNIAADHDDITMGKVQHLSDAVHHCVAQCDQSIHAAQADAVDQVGQKLHPVIHLKS